MINELTATKNKQCMTEKSHSYLMKDQKNLKYQVHREFMVNPKSVTKRNF